jgi:hypothetical protein
LPTEQITGNQLWSRHAQRLDGEETYTTSPDSESVQAGRLESEATIRSIE